MSALTPDEAKLVERLQGFVDACSGHDITLYEGHPAVLVADAASALIRIAEERGEAQGNREAADNALVGKYRAPKTGVFRFPSDVAAIIVRLEAAESIAAQALRERDEAREALRIAEAVLRNASPFETTDDGKIPIHSPFTAAQVARRALSEQPDKERT